LERRFAASLKQRRIDAGMLLRRKINRQIRVDVARARQLADHAVAAGATPGADPGAGLREDVPREFRGEPFA